MILSNRLMPKEQRTMPVGRLKHRCFRGKNGDTEHFFTITAPRGMGFPEQIKYIERSYSAALRSLALNEETAIFRRIFLSDALNQADIIQRCRLANDENDHPVAVSIIQQPPMDGAKIALLAYHIESRQPLMSERISARHVLVKKNGFGHLWSTRLCSHDTDKSYSVGRQTQCAFTNLISVLNSNGGILRDNCVRTWIYVKDIDVFYQEMVDERRALFSHHGLTRDTHFISSTGIEGSGSHRHDVVVMDAYSILGLHRHQISFLNDFDMLCPAPNYNVTFERGTRIAYADRDHVYISGTASIDSQGNVLYPTSVTRQVDRALENIAALLRAGKASLEDLMYLIVYVRDPADAFLVRLQLSHRLPFVPTIITQGAVCRSEWLVEIEGEAIISNNQPAYPDF
jgi:enamine deaminase RidA (YjgF/YER057c/UK114 family)